MENSVEYNSKSRKDIPNSSIHINGIIVIDEKNYEVHANGVKYDVLRLSRMKWRLTKDGEFFCYMKAYNIQILLDALLRFDFNDNSETFKIK